MLSTLFYLTAAATAVVAHQGAWAQCGGQSWTGSTECVSGYTCQYNNAWYSQCLPSSGGSNVVTQQKLNSADYVTGGGYPAPTTAASTTAWTTVSQSVAKSASTTAQTTVSQSATKSSSSSSPSSSSSSSSGSGKSYIASFTEYGAGDQNGSPNCNTATTACGFYTSPGYSAAVSQNEFGVGPVCYRL